MLQRDGNEWPIQMANGDRPDSGSGQRALRIGPYPRGLYVSDSLLHRAGQAFASSDLGLGRVRVLRQALLLPLQP